MKLRRGQRIAKEILDFDVINRKHEALDRFNAGDIVIPVGSNNVFDYGIVEDVDKNISKVNVNYDGNIKQQDPDEIRIYILATSLKQARRVKKASL